MFVLMESDWRYIHADRGVREIFLLLRLHHLVDDVCDAEKTRLPPLAAMGFGDRHAHELVVAQCVDVVAWTTRSAPLVYVPPHRRRRPFGGVATVVCGCCSSATVHRPAKFHGLCSPARFGNVSWTRWVICPRSRRSVVGVVLAWSLYVSDEVVQYREPTNLVATSVRLTACSGHGPPTGGAPARSGCIPPCRGRWRLGQGRPGRHCRIGGGVGPAATRSEASSGTRGVWLRERCWYGCDRRARCWMQAR